MCELFGMISQHPLDQGETLKCFGHRGGATADNPDGWGVAYWEGTNWQLHKAPEAAATSTRFSNLVRNIRSSLLIAHVRKANPPSAFSKANTHPFLRECCDRPWVFAHNGKVPEVVLPDGCCHPQDSQPLGETDSEHAFYFLLDEIANVFGTNAAGDDSAWLQKLATLSESIAAFGQFNFLMSDGISLIAYNHDRLHALEEQGNTNPWVKIASEPLSVGPWKALETGELRVYRNGVLTQSVLTQPLPVKSDPINRQLPGDQLPKA